MACLKLCLCHIPFFMISINQSIKLLLQAAWPIKTHKKTKKKGTHINDINVFACLFLNIHNTVQQGTVDLLELFKFSLWFYVKHTKCHCSISGSFVSYMDFINSDILIVNNGHLFRYRWF